MERRGRARGGGSTYGQSCMQCFKAKCRCVPSPNSDVCERCRRLNKDCQPSDAARRRNAQKASEPDVRIAQLEARIEALSSAMQSVIASAETRPDGLDLRVLGSVGSMSNSTAGSELTPSNNSTGTAGTSVEDTGDGHPSYVPHFSVSSISSPGLSPAEAEESLRFFRSEMLPCFPLLSLPYTLTASQLRRDRPILFQAIVTVTTLSTQRKLPRIEELKRLVFDSALVNAQSNMDLLLGLLTYIAWSTDAFLGRADLLSRLMALAISLVYDLRLFRPPRPDVQAIVAYTQGFPDDEEDGRKTSEGGMAPEFMERQRALLACFVLSSYIATHFGRIDALRWTSQLEDALRVVASNKSSPADETLASQVRFQLVAHRAAQLREQHETDRARAGLPASSSSSSSWSSSAAPSLSPASPSATASLLYLNTLRAEVHGIKASLGLGLESPPQPHGQGQGQGQGQGGDDRLHTRGAQQPSRPTHRQHTLLLLAAHAAFVEVFLDQSALSIMSASAPTPAPAPAPAPTSTPTHSHPGHTLDRIECFLRSAEGVRAYLDAFAGMQPARRCAGLPAHFWSQTVWCAAVLKHLSTHPDPALDCHAVRASVDLLSALDWMVGKMEMVSAEAAAALAGAASTSASASASSSFPGGGGVGGAQQSCDDLFRLLSRLFRRSRTWAEARWHLGLPTQGRPGGNPAGSVGGQPQSVGCESTAAVGGSVVAMPDVEDMSWINSMDLENDRWFEDVLGWSPANA